MSDLTSNPADPTAPVTDDDDGPRRWLVDQATDLVKMLRLVPQVILRPLAVPERWRAEPARYPSPTRMLALYATLCGLALYGLTVSGAFAEVERLREAVRQVSRFAGIVLDGWNGLMPLAIVCCALVGARVGGLLIPEGRQGWATARRVTAMLAVVYLVLTPLQFMLRPLLGSVADWGVAVIAFVYGVLAFRGLSRASWSRCIAAQLASSAIALAAMFVYSFAGGLVVGLALG